MSEITEQKNFSYQQSYSASFVYFLKTNPEKKYGLDFKCQAAMSEISPALNKRTSHISNHILLPFYTFENQSSNAQKLSIVL